MLLLHSFWLGMLADFHKICNHEPCLRMILEAGAVVHFWQHLPGALIQIPVSLKVWMFEA